MSMVCHETGIDVPETYHTICAVVRDPKTGKIAYSSLEVSLGDEAYLCVRDSLMPEPTSLFDNQSYAIQTVTGELGGFFHTVQLSRPRQAHGDFRYLNTAVVQEHLPKSYDSLQTIDTWVENINGTWEKVSWPHNH